VFVSSSTHERKSKTAIFVKHNKIYMKHNSVAEDIPVAIFMKVSG
jgi:DNA-directed RNA polymerase III subunit RPC2